jgi:predicted PurR-regulated permease PerM
MLDKQVIISVKTIIVTAFLVLCGYVIYKLAPIFGLLFISIFLVVAMEPMVRSISGITLMNKPLSRGFSVVVSYLILILVLILIVTLGLPPVIGEVQNLMSSLSKLPETINLGSEIKITLVDLLPSYSKISGSLLTATYSIFANVASIFSVLVLSAYISLDWTHLRTRFVHLFPERTSEDVAFIISKIEDNIGNWVKGQLVLMLVIGSMSFVALKSLGISSALALALIAGLLEIIPMLGPTISAILATVVGFSQDPLKGMIILALFILIQQIENNFLVPRVMQKVSGFSPIIIIFALLIGSRFFGVMGAILAVPTLMMGSIIVRRLLRYPS